MAQRTCSAPECGQPQRSGPYCPTHYHRMKKYGTTDSPTEGRVCRIEGCAEPMRSAEYEMCRSHMQLWKKYGTVAPAVVRLERFMEKVEAGPDGCWDWTASLTEQGYGRFAAGHGAPYQKAHRASWEMFRSEIPDGLEIDHLCYNRRCVNPDHLEPVSPAVNQRRRAERVTHCAEGHEYTANNTYVSKENERHCRTCHRKAMQKYRLRSARSPR